MAAFHSTPPGASTRPALTSAGACGLRWPSGAVSPSRLACIITNFGERRAHWTGRWRTWIARSQAGGRPIWKRRGRWSPTLPTRRCACGMRPIAAAGNGLPTHGTRTGRLPVARATAGGCGPGPAAGTAPAPADRAGNCAVAGRSTDRPFSSDLRPHELRAPTETRRASAARGGIAGADALVRAEDHDINGALSSCRAALNAARALGDEPDGAAQFARLDGAASAAQTIELVLRGAWPTKRNSRRSNSCWSRRRNIRIC